jgi:hypothetical protein
LEFFGPETASYGGMTKLLGQSPGSSLLKSFSVTSAASARGNNIVLDGLEASGNVTIGLGYGYGEFTAYGGTSIGGTLRVSAGGGGENQVGLSESSLSGVGLTLGGFGNTIGVGEELRSKMSSTNAAPSSKQLIGNTNITSLSIVTASAQEDVEVVGADITQSLAVRFVATGGVDAQNFFGLGESMVGNLGFWSPGNENVILTNDLILGSAGFSLGAGANTLSIGTPIAAKLSANPDLNQLEGVTINGNLAVTAGGGGSNQIMLDPQLIGGTTTVTVGQGLDTVFASGTYVGLAKFSAPLGPVGGPDIIQYVNPTFVNGVILAGFYTLPVPTPIPAPEPRPMPA